MKGMSLIVRTVSRFVKVFILLYGLYLTLTGHLTPGGGFSGGVVIACLYILLTLAYGRHWVLKKFPRRLAGGLDSVGGLIFLITACLGFGFGGLFFINFLQKLHPGTHFAFFSAGIIPINNFAICLKVASALFLVFMVMAGARLLEKKDGTYDYQQDEEE
jgi:multicomponent Na+:H+ antiporter subunit B